MNSKLVAIIAVGLLILFAIANNNAPAPSPDDQPVPADAPNFLSVFREAIQALRVDRRSAVAHAESLSGICHEAANVLEWDGEQTPPLMDTARKFNATRTMTRHFRERGGSYGELYPTLGPTIQDYLTAKVGRDDKDGVDDNTMTPEKRRQYVEAYRAGLAPAFMRAAREL